MKEFVNKRILLVCKEDFSYPLYFVAKKLSVNNTVAALWTLSTECRLNECLHNKYTYYHLKNNLKQIKIYDVKEIAEEFVKNFNAPPIDWDYVRDIENHFTHFKNLNLQLLSSQFTSVYSHYRDFFFNGTEAQNIYWLELIYKQLLGMMEDFKPEVILDLDNAELHRTVLNEIAYKYKIPYITISYPRYEKFIIPTFNLGLQNEKSFIDLYHKFYQDNQCKAYQEAKEYICHYQSQSAIMPSIFKGTITAKYHADPVFLIIKQLLGHFYYLCIDMKLLYGNFKLSRNKMLYPSSLKWMRFKARYEWKRQVLYRKNRYFENPVAGEDYVYMPLHLIPESTTSTLAPLYVNEISNIEAVSKQLPIGWKLYVKEHQGMLGERSFDFYKKIKAIPNVRLVQINFYQDPKEWIVNAKGIVTINGSTAYEAALLGKKSILFGEVSFHIMDSITKVQSYAQLSGLLRDFEKPMDTTKSAAAYIAAVKEFGMEIDIHNLINEGIRIIQTGQSVPEEYEKEIDKLIQFYIKGYDIYQEQEMLK